MNEMCGKAGMIERQIFDRTKAVFEYYNLPFDVEQPVQNFTQAGFFIQDVCL